MTTQITDRDLDYWVGSRMGESSQDALLMRRHGLFLRHGVMCSLDADLVKRVSAPSPRRRITYGAAVEAQILRDQAAAKGEA